MSNQEHSNVFFLLNTGSRKLRLKSNENQRERNSFEIERERNRNFERTASEDAETAAWRVLTEGIKHTLTIFWSGERASQPNQSLGISTTYTKIFWDLGRWKNLSPINSRLRKLAFETPHRWLRFSGEFSSIHWRKMEEKRDPRRTRQIVFFVSGKDGGKTLSRIKGWGAQKDCEFRNFPLQSTHQLQLNWSTASCLLRLIGHKKLCSQVANDGSVVDTPVGLLRNGFVGNQRLVFAELFG